MFSKTGLENPQYFHKIIFNKADTTKFIAEKANKLKDKNNDCSLPRDLPKNKLINNH